MKLWSQDDGKYTLVFAPTETYFEKIENIPLRDLLMLQEQIEQAHLNEMNKNVSNFINAYNNKEL
ncbi:MAG: hypothetical protein ACTHME_00885 [Candidatus Nitrosocosmicus sp.]